jgi:hypothetical protein
MGLAIARLILVVVEACKTISQTGSGSLCGDVNHGLSCITCRQPPARYL